jgi:hypothetical protein
MIPKYRPYLSLEEITLITSLLKVHSPESTNLLKTLNLILLKAGSELSSPAYIASPKGANSKFSPKGLGIEDMNDEDIENLFPGT